MFRSLVVAVAEGLAHLSTVIAKVAWTPLNAWLRLWRLGSMRARTGGHIPLSTQFDGPVRTFGTGILRLGEHCRLGRNVHFDTAQDGRVTLGDRVRINDGGVIVAGVSITIGDDSLVGEYVSIRDANHGIDLDELIRSQPLTTAAIRIGRGVWIGRGCGILKGVTIGDGAVIGANSVVTADIPPNTIFAGCPARQIGARS